MNRFETVNESAKLKQNPQGQYDNQEEAIMEQRITPGKCEEIQIRFLTTPEDPEVSAHLAECDECASFALFHDALIATTDPVADTPGLPIKIYRRPAVRRIWFSACAAAVALCAGTAVFRAANVSTSNRRIQENIAAINLQPDAYIAASNETTQFAANDRNNQNGEASEVSMSWDASDESQMIEALQQEFDLLYANNSDWKIQEYTPYFAME